METGLLSLDALEVDLAQAFSIDLEFVERMALHFGIEYLKDGHWRRITEEEMKHLYSRASGGTGDVRVRIVIEEATN